MGTLSVILGLGLAVLGACLLYTSLKKAKKIDRDRFNQKNKSGVVEHASYEAAQKFARDEFFNTMKLIVGGVILLLGIAAVVSGPRYDAAQEARAEKALAIEGRRLEQACDAIISGPPGGDLTPCHDLCQISSYQNWCEKTFGLPEGPPRGSRGRDF